MGYDLNKLFEVASREEGYLEKKTPEYLDDKTKNAGSNNYTKYWRDVYPRYQGSYWCLCYIIWIFQKAFGNESAKNLLLMSQGLTFSCSALVERFKKVNRFYKTNPLPGDLVIFSDSTGKIAHVGLVISTKSGLVTSEGNTSSEKGVVPNGGCVRSKKYSLTYNRIVGYCRPDFGITEKNVVATRSTIKKGSVGDDVLYLHKKLKELKYGVNPSNNKFDSTTEMCVKHFQTVNGLENDGIVGPKTWERIG